jgi:2-(1,2-epoxy-1,2-dihydrophenyl)acetyl-CoA isomerase
MTQTIETVTGFTRLRLSWADGVTHVRLDRPERRNTIDLTMARELLEVLLLERTAASRAVLLTGSGGHFCAGGDLKSFRSEPDLPGHLAAVTSYLHAAISRLIAMPAPLVIAVQGHVAGAGLGLACLADVLVAEEGSTFRSGYGALGLTPDAGASRLLPELVGLRRAQRMMLLGYVLGAEEAEQWGLCTEVVPAEHGLARAGAIARALAAGPTHALGQTGRLLRTASRRSLTDHLEDESLTLSAAAATADGAEGVAAFVEHRPPSWRRE